MTSGRDVGADASFGRTGTACTQAEELARSTRAVLRNLARLGCIWKERKTFCVVVLVCSLFLFVCLKIKDLNKIKGEISQEPRLQGLR